MKWPPTIPQGPEKWMALLNAVVGRIDRNEPKDGKGNRVAQAAGGGLSINATDNGSGGDSGEIIHPFKLLIVEDDIRVVYGTLGGVAPDGMSPGDVPPYVLSPVGSTGYIYGVVTTDEDYNINSRTLGIGATVPDDEEDEDGGGTYYVEIGSYDITDDKLTVAQAVSGSQEFAWCGGPKFALS